MKYNNHANLGMPFETYLKYIHSLYKNRRMACVNKVPTAFLPIRNRFGQIVSCKVDEKSCCDFLGRYLDIPLAVEAKSTEDERIRFAEVEEHQARFLDEFTDYPNTIGIIVVAFGLRKYLAIPWQFWRAARDSALKTKGKEKTTVTWHGMTWTTPGYASMRYEDALKEWQVEEGTYFQLPYLHKISEWLSNGKDGQTNT